jgi:hypothetical protein
LKHNDDENANKKRWETYLLKSCRKKETLKRKEKKAALRDAHLGDTEGVREKVEAGLSNRNG